MRRRKSSCPNIEPRRPSAAPNRNTVKLDLYIEDDELHPVPGRRNSPSPTSISDHRRRSSANIEDTAEEVLCLRLLSTRTRYRFGGLRVNLISPVFNMDKLFNVEFDQDSQISLIKSQQSSFDQSSLDTSSFFKASKPISSKEGKCATIVIEPESEDQNDAITRQLPLMTADLTILEESSKPMNKSHVMARSLTRIPEPEYESMQRQGKRHQSTSSINNYNNDKDNVKFDSVKVYAKVEPPDQSLIDSINLESKELLSLTSRSSNSNNNNNKNLGKKESKIKEMKRHAHFYCHIPSSMSQKPST